MRRTVAKVGGSLYDLPDLRERLQVWVSLVDGPILFVPGGGDGADTIRRLDRTHGLGDEAAHWVGLRLLTVNAHFLARLLDATVAIEPTAWGPGLRVLDPHCFCVADEGRPGSLPHGWHVTSDTVAARAAEVADADLMLLKSTDLPGGMSWAEAAAAGMVDPTFDPVIRRAKLRAGWINLRSPAFRRQ